MSMKSDRPNLLVNARLVSIRVAASGGHRHRAQFLNVPHRYSQTRITESSQALYVA